VFKVGDGDVDITYTLALDEGCLPVEIDFHVNKQPNMILRYRITDRRQVNGEGWFPYRTVRLFGPRDGDGPRHVDIVEVTEVKVEPPSASDMQIVLPLMCAVHLGDIASSQFVNDVERSIDLDEISQLIADAKKIANGEPRGNFLRDPKLWRN
jgi:hypothetical protein